MKKNPLFYSVNFFKTSHSGEQRETSRSSPMSTPLTKQIDWPDELTLTSHNGAWPAVCVCCELSLACDLIMWHICLPSSPLLNDGNDFLDGKTYWWCLPCPFKTPYFSLSSNVFIYIWYEHVLLRNKLYEICVCVYVYTAHSHLASPSPPPSDGSLGIPKHYQSSRSITRE